MPELHSQILGLKEKDVFLETKPNDTTYFSIAGLPSTLSYGKHPFSITFNDPVGKPLLKNLSNIVFEFVDSRGVVIFSSLVDIKELSGAGNGFVWIKKDPLRTADEIADGPAFFYVMGELDGKEIPKDWKDIYNVRSEFQYDIRKDFPNTSPIILPSPIDIQSNLSVSETIDFDTGDSVFKRSFINVSLSNLETNGGKIEAVELAYNEEKAKTDDFEVITSYPLTSGSFETDDQTATSGLNPITNTTKIITPKQFRRDTPVKFRLRFLNPAKQLAQHLDEDRQGDVIEITSSFVTFEGSPTFIEKEDNLLKGSMYTGNKVGKGFEQSGKSSAFLKTVDYTGFKSASLGKGSAGLMFFSGSVLTSSGDDYQGVGLELVANSESFLRFRSNPSIFDVRAQSFFVGSETTQFVSGSGGNIEISSSMFHLDPKTSTLSISGSITANDGTIGGWNIEDDKLVNTQNTVELSSTTPGLNIKDGGGTERVTIKSGSFLTIGDGTQYVKNKSFEEDSTSAGRNIVSSALSWSFNLGGKASASITDRSGYSDDEKAVSGDNTLDIVVPEGSANYTSATNTYEVIQVVTASFSQGDTLSFSGVARFSSSFGGKGKDRALGPQYFRLEYSSSTSNGFRSFLPANDFTASNGYGEYFLGSGQYNSFGASAEMPEPASFVKIILSGSINDDSGYTVKKPLFAEKKRNKDFDNKTFDKVIKGSATPEYPETELNFDNFSLRSNSRKVELTEKGLLIYNSEDSFLKMDATGIEFRGGSGVTAFGTSVSRETFTNDSDVAGRLGAPVIQSYESDPEDIGTTAFDGNVSEYAKGNHRHRITFSTINSVVEDNVLNVGGLVSSGDITAERMIIKSTVSNITQSFSSGSTKFGDDSGDKHEFTGSVEISGSFLVNGGGVATVAGSDTQVQFNDGSSLGGSSNFTFNKTSNLLAVTAGVSGSSTSTGSFGLILQNGVPIEAGAGGSNTQIQFNDGGSLEGDSSFVFNKTTGLITGTAFTGIFRGVISGSAQIASNISGSFTDVSSSFSTRLTTEESNIDSLQTDSGSFSTRLTTAETELSNTLISGSAQIATEISGSLGTNATFIRGLTEAGVSGSFTKPSSSFSTRVTGLESASGSFSTRVTTLEALDVDDDLNFAGDSGTGTIDLDSETFTIAGGSGLSSTASGNSVTLNLDN